ncbi:MAG: hypothetical protein ABI629_09940 [bacterium]
MIGVDRPVTSVACLPLIDGVSVTVLRDDLGWRFGSWTRGGMAERSLPPPRDADRELRFDSARLAATYFAAQYETRLRRE